MKEVWKDIPGYEGLYQVSDLGKIKSLNFKKSGRERLLNGCLLNTGYLQVKLSKQRISSAFLAHQIVAMAFLDHYPKSRKIVVNHINFNRVDNRLSNLEITTQRKNANRKHLISKSKYTGVSLNRTGKKWVSQVLFN